MNALLGDTEIRNSLCLWFISSSCLQKTTKKILPRFQRICISLFIFTESYSRIQREKSTLNIWVCFNNQHWHFYEILIAVSNFQNFYRRRETFYRLPLNLRFQLWEKSERDINYREISFHYFSCVCNLFIQMVWILCCISFYTSASKYT